MISHRLFSSLLLCCFLGTACTAEDGADGAQGTQGAQGAPGPQGPKGDTGPQGPAGPQGEPGPANGPQGPQGPVGPQGPKGDTGPQGPQGYQGYQGPKGDTGPQGAQGLPGPKGDTGATGAQGAKGDTGPQGAQGPKGDTGLQGPPGATAPQICTPGEPFCEDNTVWACTKTGTDAILSQRCASGSPTNPTGCFTTGCSINQGACCRPERPVFFWNFTTPAESGSLYLPGVITGVGEFYGSAPSEPCPGSTDNFYVSLTRYRVGACTEPSAFENFSIQISRPLTTPDKVYTLPNSNIIMRHLGSASCSSWTGSVTWHSDTPNWKISINATCSETGKTGIRLVGTLNGER